MDINRIIHLLRCVDCHNEILDYSNNALKCNTCGREYKITKESIILMKPNESLPLPFFYHSADYTKYLKMMEKYQEDFYYSNLNSIVKWMHFSAHKIISNWRKNSDNFVLDLGCGTGDHFRFVKNKSNLIGLDISLPYLKGSRKINPDTFLIQGDIYNLPFRDNVLKEVLSIYNLEHIFYLGLGLTEIHRIMKDDGCFFCGLPTEGGFLWEIGRRFSTERNYKNKYGINYRVVSRIEHCNTMDEVVKKLKLMFTIKKAKYFPFSFRSLNFNLTLSLMLKKKK